MRTKAYNLMRIIVTIAATVMAGTMLHQRVWALGTPDGLPPAHETACAGLTGAAFGLCNAFCQAQDCDVHPRPSCDQLRRNFERLTGAATFPCEVAPPPTSTATDTATATPTDTATATETATPTATPTNTPAPLVECCEVVATTTGPAPAPFCFDAAAPDVLTECQLLGGFIFNTPNVCNPTIGICQPPPVPTSSFCCQCPVSAPPFPAPQFCYEGAVGGPVVCPATCIQTTGFTCDPVSEMCVQ